MQNFLPQLQNSTLVAALNNKPVSMHKLVYELEQPYSTLFSGHPYIPDSPPK